MDQSVPDGVFDGFDTDSGGRAITKNTRGRPRSTCAGLGLTPGGWCEACCNPKKKLKCRASSTGAADATGMRQEASSQPATQSASPPAPEDAGGDLPELRSSTNFPELFEPVDFRTSAPKHSVLERVPKRKAVQLLRTEELTAQEAARQNSIREEAAELARQVSAAEMKKLQFLLEDAMVQVSANSAECTRLLRERSKVMDSK